VTVKGFSLLPRRPDLTAAEFHLHWSTTHRDHALRIPILRRYVQLHRIDAVLPGFTPAIYDGVPEVWFDSLEVAASLATDPRYTEYAGRDEPNFIDIGRMAGLTTEEHVVRAGPEVGRDDRLIKGLILLRGTDRDALRAWILGPWSAAVAAGAAHAVRHVESTAINPGPDRTGYDAATELWWEDETALAADRRALEELAVEAAAGPGIRPSAGSVPDPAAVVALVGRELRVIWP
jgi:uncharacterized protein (TIGR02118 family)